MIAIVIIIHRGLARKPNSRLQNDTALFILPVHFNHFSCFIVIPFLREMKTCCCCCCCNNYICILSLYLILLYRFFLLYEKM